MMSMTTLVLLALATARLTRLVTQDRVTQAPRYWLVRRAVKRGGDESLIAYLIVCDWCVSIYTGAAVAGAWWAWHESAWLTWVLSALAFSYVAGWLASKEEA